MSASRASSLADGPARARDGGRCAPVSIHHHSLTASTARTAPHDVGSQRSARRPTTSTCTSGARLVKRLWYQTRAMRDLAPSTLEPMVDVLDQLSDLLGADRGIFAVLVGQLATTPDLYGGQRAVTTTIEAAHARQADLRERSIRLGATLLAGQERTRCVPPSDRVVLVAGRRARAGTHPCGATLTNPSRWDWDHGEPCDDGGALRVGRSGAAGLRRTDARDPR